MLHPSPAPLYPQGGGPIEATPQAPLQQDKGPLGETAESSEGTGLCS